MEFGVSETRIATRLAQLSEIGARPCGGMQRLSYSREEHEAQVLLADWLRDLDLHVSWDEAGNVIGRCEGSDPHAPAIMTGSHLDTQLGGGRFDGAAGVVAAVEAVAAIKGSGLIHRHPIEVVAWAGEEGSARFDLGLIGSRAMVGALKPDDLNMQCRLTGQTLREAMQSLQIDPAEIAQAERPAGTVRAVIELHIEQGPQLESSGSQIGVVTAVAGNTRLPLRIRGQQAHSGGMPMHLRRDALCGAAEILLRAEGAARRRTSPPVVVSAGYFHHEPRSIAIIPGVAEMTLDVRSVDARAIDEVVEEIRREAINIAERRGLEVDFEPTWGTPPARLDQEISAVIVQACEDVGVTWKELASGAGHDSMMLARRFPAGMVFVPSVGGISHAPDEFTPIEDLTAGAMVLCRSIAHLAE